MVMNGSSGRWSSRNGSSSIRRCYGGILPEWWRHGMPAMIMSHAVLFVNVNVLFRWMNLLNVLPLYVLTKIVKHFVQFFQNYILHLLYIYFVREREWACAVTRHVRKTTEAFRKKEIFSPSPFSFPYSILGKPFSANALFTRERTSVGLYDGLSRITIQALY